MIARHTPADARSDIITTAPGGAAKITVISDQAKRARGFGLHADAAGSTVARSGDTWLS